MENINVKLTINGETKEVEGYISDRPYAKLVVVTGLKMKTTQGNKEHTGWAEFRFNEDLSYNIDDAVDLRYVGMRGNGRAKRSQFRKVSF